MAKVTEQLNKKVAESNEKAEKAISNVEQRKDKEIERLNQQIRKLNESKDTLKENNSATVDRLKKQIKTLQENHKEDTRRQVCAKEQAIRNEYQPQQSKYLEAMSANERLEKQLAEAKGKIECLESDQRTSKEDYSMLAKRLTKTEEQLKRTQESQEKHKQDKSQANKNLKELSKFKDSRDFKAEEAIRDANIAQKNSEANKTKAKDYESKLKKVQQELKLTLQLADQRKDMIDKLEKELAKAKLSSPITTTARDTLISKKGGAKLYSPKIWFVMLRLLSIGVPLSAIPKCIHVVGYAFSPQTDFSKFPLVDTARRARTVLGTMCGALAALKLARAPNWKQLFTDATTRQ